MTATSERDRWRRIRATFDHVFDLPSSQRPAAIDAAGLETTVREELDALLAHARASPDFLERRLPSPSIDEDQSGSHIGPYRLMRRIGRGGTSVVYAAERADGVHDQAVAIKLLKPDFRDERWNQRFQLERRILARLDHPRIARLLDGGTTVDGLPFAVMELVEGEPIDSHCRHRALGLEARLRLFRSVCLAVRWAHRNLVVHRDLKPSNILVSASGEPKLLDFGIAKLLDRPPTAASLTGAHVRLLTPGYASPEQVRGELVTTASDVYSLGVVLFELLTGEMPLAVGGLRLAELERVMAETHPAYPSVALGDLAALGLRGRPERLRNELRGDLDAVVLRALAHEPAERYAAVDDLLDDLDRYLGGQPVRARPGTWLERSIKWCRRNRFAVAVGSLFLGLVVVFGVVSGWQASNVRRERDLATAAAARATATLSFFVDLFDRADPEIQAGEPRSIASLLDYGSEQARHLYPNRPSERVPLLEVLAKVNHQLGRYEEAVSLRRDELALRRRTGDESMVVPTLNDLGNSLLLARHLDRAEAAYREAQALAHQEAVGPPEVAESLAGLGLVFHGRGDLETATDFLRQAVALFRQASPAAPKPLSEALYNLALVERDAGRLEVAERLLQEASQIERSFAQGAHPRLGTTMMILATIRSQRGDLESAASLASEAVRILRESLPAGHPKTTYAIAHAAEVARRSGDLVLAEERYREALSLTEPPFDEGSIERASLLNNLANVLRDRGELGDAEQMTREALASYRSHFPTGHPNTVAALSNLGLYRANRGDRAGAREHYRDALEMGRKVLGEEHPALAYTELRWGRLEREAGNLGAAETHLQRAVALRRAALGTEHPLTVEAAAVLADGADPRPGENPSGKTQRSDRQ